MYLADSMTMTHPDHPILALRLYIEVGETFRVAPSIMGEVDMNLSIANLDFADYRGAVEMGAGIFRGINQ